VNIQQASPINNGWKEPQQTLYSSEKRTSKQPLPTNWVPTSLSYYLDSISETEAGASKDTTVVGPVGQHQETTCGGLGHYVIY